MDLLFRSKVINDALYRLNRAKVCIEADSLSLWTEAFCHLHTIKGNFSYFQEAAILTLCDELETILAGELSREKKLEALIKTEALLRLVDGLDSLSSTGYPEETFGALFSCYEKVAAKTAAKLGKKICFTLIGGELKLPSAPVQELFHQLMHLIRNSVDHGIEAPAERARAGKNPEGLLILKFEVEEEVLCIHFSDDGSGVKSQSLLQKYPEIASEEAVMERIKTGGLSTKQVITEISGRGAGLSSLNSFVMKTKGTLEITSGLSQGTTVNIRIPLQKSFELAS